MRTLLVPALIFAAGGVAYTQSEVPRPAPDPALPRIAPTNVPATVKAEGPDRTLDQLLDRLEALQAQKAELEKAEAELMREVRRRLEKQSDRLNRLGIPPREPVRPAATSAADPLVAPTSFAPPVVSAPRN